MLKDTGQPQGSRREGVSEGEVTFSWKGLFRPSISLNIWRVTGLVQTFKWCPNWRPWSQAVESMPSFSKEDEDMGYEKAVHLAQDVGGKVTRACFWDGDISNPLTSAVKYTGETNLQYVIFRNKESSSWEPTGTAWRHSNSVVLKWLQKACEVLQKCFIR